jgi:DNA-binding transcriptional LysR family regulator
MDVHLRDLRALLAVAEEGTVTGAAERLHLAQPALSKQLQAFERTLGHTVLLRLPRGVALTEAGEALLAPAREAVEAWDRAQTALQQVASAGTLVIGMQTAVGRGLQRRALDRLATRAPGVRPSLRLIPWSDPTAGLGDGSCDVAFVWLPVPDVEVDVVEIAREPRHVALPADSRWAGQAAVAFADLLDEPFVALPASAGSLRDFWLGVPDRQGRAPVVGAVAETADAALEAVSSGLGVVLLAAGNVAIYQRPGVVTRPVEGLAPAVLALAWRAGDTRRSVAAFAEAVDAAVHEPVD